MTTREQSHRRTLLLAVAVLIILAMSPVFGHHLALRADALLAGRDHVSRICIIALHLLLAPVHQFFHVMLVTGFLYAAWDRWRAGTNLRSTLALVRTSIPSSGDPIGVAATRSGIPLERVRVVDGLPNPAFTAGFWRPRIFVAAELTSVLEQAQLDAVLAHEAAHARRRDPLRLSALRFLASTLFYLPALRRMADDLADEAEIDADDAAAARGSPLVLASAILALAHWGARVHGAANPLAPSPIGGMVGFQPFFPLGRVDLLERRIHRLAGEPAAVGTHVTRRSLGAAGGVLLAVWISGVTMAHPLPDASKPLSETHCRHVGALALSHVFCLGFGTRDAGAPCPHTGL